MEGESWNLNILAEGGGENRKCSRSEKVHSDKKLSQEAPREEQTGSLKVLSLLVTFTCLSGREAQEIILLSAGKIKGAFSFQRGQEQANTVDLVHFSVLWQKNVNQICSTLLIRMSEHW